MKITGCPQRLAAALTLSALWTTGCGSFTGGPGGAPLSAPLEGVADSLIRPLGNGASGPSSSGSPLSGPRTGDLGSFGSPETFQTAASRTREAERVAAGPPAAPLPAGSATPAAAAVPDPIPRSSPIRPGNMNSMQFLSDTGTVGDGAPVSGEAGGGTDGAAGNTDDGTAAGEGPTTPSWRLPPGTMI